MKKVLWFIVAVLLVATFSDHPKILPYKQQLYSMFADSTQNASAVKTEQALRQLGNRFAELAETLGKGQQTELKDIASSADKVRQFDQQYCREGQFHPLFYGDSISKVCLIIQEQQGLL